MTHDYQQVTQQRGRMTALAGLLLAALCATLVVVSWTSEGAAFDFHHRWPTLVGLSGLIAIFVLYAQLKHRQLAVMEARVHELAIREATVQARFSELSFLFDISTQLQLRLDLQGMLELATQRLLPCLDAHQSSIMLHNPETGMLEVQATAGVDSGLIFGGAVKPGEGIAGIVFQNCETLNLTPEVMRRRFADEVKQGRTIAAALCVPMRFRGTPIGIVSVSRTSGEPFGELHARMLEAFADHCAATVVKTHHHHELLKQVRKAA